MNTQGFQCTHCLIKYAQQEGNFYRANVYRYKVICIDCELSIQKQNYYKKHPIQKHIDERWHISKNEDISDELAAKYMEVAKKLNASQTWQPSKDKIQIIKDFKN